MSINILYLGFNIDFNINTCPLNILLFKFNKNIILKQLEYTDYENFAQYDIIIIPNNIINISLEVIEKYKNKILLYVFFNINYSSIIFNYYINNNIFSIGYVQKSSTSVMYPFHLIDAINTHNKTNSNISNVNNTNIGCVILDESDIISKNIQQILCSSCNINIVNSNNKNNYIILNICRDLNNNLNVLNNSDIVITDTNIDTIDKSIYNIHRILYFDYFDKNSILNLISKINMLITSSTIDTFYNQPIFTDSAYNIIKSYQTNLINKVIKQFPILNNFVSTINNNSLSINNLKYIQPHIPQINSIKSNIVIIFKTSYDNIQTSKFTNTINTLNNNIITPKYILVKVNSNDDNEPYDIINKDINNLIISVYKSKTQYEIIEHLLYMTDILDPYDKIIFIKDNFIVCDTFIYLYDLCYQLYWCDGIVSTSNDNLLFWDNYSSTLNIADTYSFLYKNITNIILDVDSNINEDLLLYNHYKLHKLYICGIGFSLLKNDVFINNEDHIDNINFNYYNNISERYLLYNISNIKNILYDDKHIDYKYYNNNVLLITITYYKKNITNDDITIQLYKNTNNLNNIYLNISNNYSYRLTLAYKTNIELLPIIHNYKSYNVFQIHNDSNNRKKFFSMLTILCSLPELKYINFDIINIIDYIDDSRIQIIYNKINDDILKTELFKFYYLYYHGGIYINDNLYILNNLDILQLHTKNNEIFCTFDKSNKLYVYSHCIISTCIKSLLCKKYLSYLLYNIYNEGNPLEYYSADFIFDLYTTTNIHYTNLTIKNKLNDIQYIKYNDIELFKVVDNIFFEHTTRCINKWMENTLYSTITIDYKKFTGIDHILWINLDRDIDKKNYMTDILKNIDIPNTRITAIDGSIVDLSSLNNLDRPICNIEKAVTLSHIKAIHFLKNVTGKYFLVLEDDVIFNDIILFNETLEDIILKCPEFDILMVHKICNYNINQYNTYTNFKDTDNIWSTLAYIISRKGIEKIRSFTSYDIDNNSFHINKQLSVADRFLYNNVDTYFYKYNYFRSLDKVSSIHPGHLYLHKLSSETHLKNIIEDWLT